MSLTPLKQIKNLVSEKRSHNLCICHLCWRDASIQGEMDSFSGPKPGFNVNSGDPLAPKICLTNLVTRALFPGFGVVVWPQKSLLNFTVRLKDGMRLRSSMWHGLRNDIIMRSIIIICRMTQRNKLNWKGRPFWRQSICKSSRFFNVADSHKHSTCLY